MNINFRNEFEENCSVLLVMYAQFLYANFFADTVNHTCSEKKTIIKG